MGPCADTAVSTSSELIMGSAPGVPTLAGLSASACAAVALVGLAAVDVALIVAVAWRQGTGGPC
jgi:hypothetical protein